MAKQRGAMSTKAKTAPGQMIELGFGDTRKIDRSKPVDSQRSTDFLVRVHSSWEAFEDVTDVIKDIGGYNDFSGPAVADWLWANRRSISYVGFGREGSPVLYVTFIDEIGEVAESDLKEVAEMLAADDYGILNYTKHLGTDTRLWWD